MHVAPAFMFPFDFSIPVFLHRREGEKKGNETTTTIKLKLFPDGFFTLPDLAERCYHLIYQLCVHPRTSSSTMRYLRTHEDFFTRHLSTIPSHVPPIQMQQQQDPPTVEVLYSDGFRVTTTVSTLCSFLRSRSWIFDLVPLDLHVLTSKGRGGSRSISEVLDILFGN